MKTYLGTVYKKTISLRRNGKNHNLASMSPGRRAQRTARWARTMTKWLVTYNHRDGAKWNIVNFNGPNGAESRGIVDLLAIRKDHRSKRVGLKLGDLFEIVLIQTKGGSALRPTTQDLVRLLRVAKHYHAKAVVLVEWQCKKKLAAFRLAKGQWNRIDPAIVFG